MKKLITVLFCLMVISICILPCSAVDNREVIFYAEEVLENGIVVVDTITENNPISRSMSRSVTREKIYYFNDEVIAEIAITATFRYDTQSVSVVSKSISKCETYDGWSFKQTSFTSSGGTVSLTGKLTKLLVLNANVSISLTCDENGNIS